MSNELEPQNHGEYGEIISIIERSRENAFRAVNREMISMYWDIGEYVSNKVKDGGWGKEQFKNKMDNNRNYDIMSTMSKNLRGITE